MCFGGVGARGSAPQPTSLHPCTPPTPATHAQDSFGNYCVQYVLELGQREASAGIMRTLAGHVAELSMQKFSSNVVEKCLKLGGLDSDRDAVVRELAGSPLLGRLLQDSYGNVSHGPCNLGPRRARWDAMQRHGCTLSLWQGICPLHPRLNALFVPFGREPGGCAAAAQAPP